MVYRRAATRKKKHQARKRGVTISSNHYYANTYPTAKHSGNDWRKSVGSLHKSNLPVADFIGSFRRGRLGRTSRSVARTAVAAALRRAALVAGTLHTNTNIFLPLTYAEFNRFYTLMDKHEERTLEENAEFEILRERYIKWKYGLNA
jgi:hypothetical protein